MPASRRKKNGINRNRLLSDNNRHVLDNAGRRAMAPGTVHGNTMAMVAAKSPEPPWALERVLLPES